METYLVAYDICEPKRLRRVARTCEDFGFRRQYSVFLCRLSAHDLVKLKSRLYDEIDLLRAAVAQRNEQYLIFLQIDFVVEAALELYQIVSRQAT